jgi:hypothetical protein
MTNRDRAEALLRWSAFTCALVGTALWLGPWLLRPSLLSNDAAHHVFWLYRYADSGLFPGDPSIEYFSSNSVAPYGYRALYAVIAPWFDVLTAAEWLSVPLLGCSAWLAWRLGRDLETPDPTLVGLLAVVTLMLLLPLVDLHPAMAFQRTFALPLTLLCLWALVVRRYVWVGISWLSAALVYPVIIPVLGLTGGLVFLADLVRTKRMPAHWLLNGVLGVSAVLIVLLGSGTPDGVGPMVSFAQAMAMPEFGPGGRQQLFGVTVSGNWFHHHRTGLGWSPPVVLTLCIALAVLAVRGHLRRVPPAAWFLAATGLVLWFAARLVLFDLYLPNRHSRWSLSAFAIVVFALAVHSLAAARATSTGSGQSIGPRWSTALAFLAPLVVVASLLPAASAKWSQPEDADLERAYDYLAAMPRDTLIMAHPDLANFVPVRTQHSVVASTEAAIAFMQGYYARYRPRMEDSLRVAYATSWQEVDEIADRYGADVVLTGPQVWASAHYDAGFEELMHELWQRSATEDFVLRTPSPERVLFRSGEVYVVKSGAAGAREAGDVVDR